MILKTLFLFALGLWADDPVVTYGDLKKFYGSTELEIHGYTCQVGSDRKVKKMKKPGQAYKNVASNGSCNLGDEIIPAHKIFDMNKSAIAMLSIVSFLARENPSLEGLSKSQIDSIAEKVSSKLGTGLSEEVGKARMAKIDYGMDNKRLNLNRSYKDFKDVAEAIVGKRVLPLDKSINFIRGVVAGDSERIGVVNASRRSLPVFLHLLFLLAGGMAGSSIVLLMRS